MLNRNSKYKIVLIMWWIGTIKVYLLIAFGIVGLVFVITHYYNYCCCWSFMYFCLLFINVIDDKIFLLTLHTKYFIWLLVHCHLNLEVQYLICPVAYSESVIHVPIPIRPYKAISKTLYLKLSITRICCWYDKITKQSFI